MDARERSTNHPTSNGIGTYEAGEEVPCQNHVSYSFQHNKEPGGSENQKQTQQDNSDNSVIRSRTQSYTGEPYAVHGEVPVQYRTHLYSAEHNNIPDIPVLEPSIITSYPMIYCGT